MPMGMEVLFLTDTCLVGFPVFHAGLEFFVTEKVDGTSYSCYRKQSENGKTFGVCSRNNELLETPDDFYWKYVLSSHS